MALCKKRCTANTRNKRIYKKYGQALTHTRTHEQEQQQLVSYCIFSFPIFIFRLHAEVLVRRFFFFIYLKSRPTQLLRFDLSAVDEKRDRHQCVHLSLFSRNSLDTCFGTHNGHYRSRMSKTLESVTFSVRPSISISFALACTHTLAHIWLHRVFNENGLTECTHEYTRACMQWFRRR